MLEIKKSTIGPGSKVPHLSYIGDATIGRDVNIGAGSITCNYDGEKKWPTTIGDNCFVGSDVMMVAPVTLGENSLIGAGSVITKDVSAGALGLGRARQTEIEHWNERKKEQMSNMTKTMAIFAGSTAPELAEEIATQLGTTLRQR